MAFFIEFPKGYPAAENNQMNHAIDLDIDKVESVEERNKDTCFVQMVSSEVHIIKMNRKDFQARVQESVQKFHREQMVAQAGLIKPR